MTLNDVTVLLLFGVALRVVWTSASMAAGAAILTGAMLTLPLKGSALDTWHGTPVFPGQPALVFVCIALAVIHERLGERAAHRVWHYTSVTLVIMAFVMTKFAADGQPDIALDVGRIWASTLFMFIFVGGIGQIIWRTFHLNGFSRYSVTWFAFPVASLANSLITFYTPDYPNFWELAARSSLSATFYGTILLFVALVLFHFYPSTVDQQRKRIARSFLELRPNVSRSDHRSVSRQRR